MKERKEKKEKVCPLAKGEDIWTSECKFILKYYCPFSSMPHMKEAMEKGLPDCPHSWD